LLGGLHAALLNLEAAGCRQVRSDGSFVSAKPLPQDYDGCWSPDGVDLSRVDPVLLDYSSRRAAMKAKYLGELFIETLPAVKGMNFIEFFQQDRDGARKGLVLIPLRSLS